MKSTINKEELKEALFEYFINAISSQKLSEEFWFDTKKTSDILIKYQKDWDNIKVWKEWATPYQEKRKNVVIEKAMKELLKSLDLKTKKPNQ